MSTGCVHSRRQTWCPFLLSFLFFPVSFLFFSLPYFAPFWPLRSLFSYSSQHSSFLFPFLLSSSLFPLSSFLISLSYSYLFSFLLSLCSSSESLLPRVVVSSLLFYLFHQLHLSIEGGRPRQEKGQRTLWRNKAKSNGHDFLLL